MLEKLKSEDFAGRIGETFRITVEGVDPIELHLIEASGLPAKDGEAQRKPFSLLFRGPMEPVLQQQIWELEHSELGKLPLFLVPLGPDKEGMRYEAVFT